MSLTGRLDRNDYWLLAALTALALITRLYGFWQWPLVDDEVFSVQEAAERAVSAINPASYVLMAASFDAFGTSEWAARLYAVTFGVLSVPLFFLTWRRPFGTSVATIGAILILASSWHLWHSQYARFYGAIFFFSSLAYYLYYRSLELGRLSYLIGSLLAVVAAFLFHPTAVLVAVVCGLFSVAVLVPRFQLSAMSRRIAWWHIGIGVVAAVPVLVIALRIAGNWAASPQHWGHEGPLVNTLRLAREIGIPLAIAAAFGFLYLWGRDRAKALLLGLAVGIPVALLAIGALLFPVRSDYVFHIMPAVFLLAAFACHQVSEALRSAGFARHVLTVTLLVAMLPAFVTYYTDKRSLDEREVASFLHSVHRPGDHVLAYSMEVSYYVEDDILSPREGNPYGTSIGWAKRLAPYLDGAGCTWLVFETRRTPMASPLENWLRGNASLVWRKYSTRYDPQVRGYEVYVVEGRQRNADRCQAVASSVH